MHALGFRQTTFLTVGAVAGALAMVVLHPVIGLPLAAASLAALSYGGRPMLALGVSVVAGVLAGVSATGVPGFPLVGVPITARGPFVLSALMVAVMLLVGPATAALLRRRSAAAVAALLAVALTGIEAVALASLASGAGQPLNAYLTSSVLATMREAGVTGLLAGQTGGQDLARQFVSMWPSMLLVTNGLSAMIGVVGAGIAGVRFAVPVRRIPPLMVLDLDPRMALVPISAGALLAAGRLPVAFAGTLDTIGMNLLVVARWVFFVQGLAVFAGLYQKGRIPRLLRAIGFAALGVTEVLIPLVSLTGLADVWLNVRRLPREGSATEQPPVSDDAD